MSTRLKPFLRRFRRDEDGSVAVEFVLYFTLMFFILSAAVEIAYMNLRHAMLERSVDLTVRDIRLGTGHIPEYADVRADICEQARIIDDCDGNLRLEMAIADPRNFQPLDPNADCVNAEADPHPVRRFEHGQDNHLMLLRACMKFKPIFPTTGIAAEFNLDDQGYMQLVSTAAFVQEPR